EVQQAGRPAQVGNWYAVRIVADREPGMELLGLDRQTETAMDAVLPLNIKANDDFGLDELGLFQRRPGKADWTPIVTWSGKEGGKFATELDKKFSLSLSALGAAEGEKIEILVQAKDNDPSRAGRWVAGPGATLILGGEGAVLQILYEQILRTEAEILALHA